MEGLGCELEEFPIKYLGMQLALRPLTKAEWQLMIDKVIHCVPVWQRGMIEKSGRKSVIAARPTHHLLVAGAPTWVMEEIVKWMRAFFWGGKKEVHGGQCLVTWDTICKPTQFGGLGVKDLRLQGLALRVRWIWLRRMLVYVLCIRVRVRSSTPTVHVPSLYCHVGGFSLPI
jgi:hypothetical protein